MWREVSSRCMDLSHASLLRAMLEVEFFLTPLGADCIGTLAD
jgi:hypothetical protein